MKPIYQSSKLYQADLYDQIKDNGNRIVCLGQEQTKTFILLAALRNRAHQLHPNYGPFITIIVEPDKEHADDRQRIIDDHTELNVVNLFKARHELNLSAAQVFIISLEDVFSSEFHQKQVNLVILDFAHLLLSKDAILVQKVVKHFENIQVLAFMCSLIHNNHELTPVSTVQLINQLESIFTAKCETSSDLRSLSRQSPVKELEILEFNPSELLTCDWFLLADSMLKQFCELLLDENLDDNEPLIKPETNLSDISSRLPALSLQKQHVLVRSCLSDVIYAIHCLGLWCAKKTIQLYLTEFSRLLQNETPVGDLIASAATILNCFFGRLDELTVHYNQKSNDDILLQGSSQQLKALLTYINEFKSNANAPWPICIVHVRRRVIAKVIALWLDKVANNSEEYSFIKANYIVGSTRKHRNRLAVDNFDLHHETAVRDFRFGNCNTLVTSAVCERCTDMPRCNLVVSFDLPVRFSDFIQAKGNCRFDFSKYVVMLNSLIEVNSNERLLSYINMERLLNDVNKKVTLEADETALMSSIEAKHEPYPNKNSKNPATIWRSIGIINKYCTKLPSDSFTKLSPEWCIKELKLKEGVISYYCEIRLPINSPVRQTIVGPPSPTKNVAMRMAAFTACKVLHMSGELDDNMMPITKESMKVINHPGGPKEFVVKPKARGPKGKCLGSTKHRQYYKKRIAEVFSGPLVAEGIPCYLYKFKMVLTCPIPDEQNRRGRRIIDPSETNRNYAIVCTRKLPKICSFPVFTRSGEVLISVNLIGGEFSLQESQVKDLRTFHEYTFSKVLRLEKYPTIYQPDESPFTVLLAPVIDKNETTSIDWSFVNKIVKSDQDSYMPTMEGRKAFKFNHEDYVDAVVIPWYRLTDRQQFAYYVAEICTDLSPSSPFPDEGSGFKTFIDYYHSKYDIDIYNKDQPVLDVDHTSARLNLLTPRYVNRKGRTLPSSTAKTRRESRESLVQKQLLIPELCSIHPFPASFWRKAVCLPCIFYRLNSLFLAEELRREVAADTKIGFIEPPPDFEWPALDFGWSLKDVINTQATEQENLEANSENSTPKEVKKVEKKLVNKPKKPKISQVEPVERSNKEELDYVIDYFDPSKYDIPDIPLDAPQSDWMNIKLISSSSADNGNGPSGWDQPLEQHDLLLEHTNEMNWSDCEMEFDGEISERVAQMRCGSPSAFEPGFKSALDLSTDFKQLSRGAPSRTVKFDNRSESSNEDVKQQNQPANLESDISWSISDDENADTGNSDDEVRCYGEWKDSKSKNRPLLKGLFLPSVRTVPGSTTTDIESLFKILGTHSSCLGQVNQDLVASTIKTLKTKKIGNDEGQKLVSILNEIFEERIMICDDDIEDTLKTWYSLLNDLSSRVDLTLLKNPDLFKDNGIELVTVDDSFEDYNLEIQPTFGELLPNRDADCNWPNEDWKNIKFDPTRKEITSVGPGPSVILQALTMSNASDGINLERLETVGDSFLKYSITAYLYCMYPSMHEGKLSYLRSTEISNANLYQLGRSKSLGEIMSATKFEPNDNWLAPGYSVAESASGKDNHNNKKREIDKALAEVPYDLLLQHSIPDKSIADCVEALIGAYLTASGSRAALLFMQWLGLRVVPPSFNLKSDLERSAGDDGDEIWRWLETPPSPMICIPPHFDEKADPSIEKISDEVRRTLATEELDRLYFANNLDKFEKDIHYTFKDKAYLVQAFTHNSFYENHVTDCHQRLEFLGDALLDYLITRYLFEDPRCHSPGTLTDLRSALVNNTFFASLAVKYKFHKYLKYISDELFNVIDGFVKKFRFDSKDTITKGYTLLISEGESEYAEDIEVPKALGDVFESVAGAIYLDSGMSLDQVWHVYFKMMKPEIEYFSSNVPKSPIRELLESMPQNVRFSPSELAPDRKHRVIAEVFGLGRFTGVGRNKHSAKSTAAKRALRMLALRRKEHEYENSPQHTDDE